MRIRITVIKVQSLLLLMGLGMLAIGYINSMGSSHVEYRMHSPDDVAHMLHVDYSNSHASYPTSNMSMINAHNFLKSEKVHSSDQTMNIDVLESKAQTIGRVQFSDSSDTALQKQRDQPSRHIVFVKVHKAASSTMHNIFMRYALGHDLDVMLRRSSKHIGERSYAIPAFDLYPPISGSKYDILCNHLIFNYTEISSFFPNDTVYIGTIREPFSQFLSAFKYYGQFKNGYLGAVLEANPINPIEEFLNNSSAYSAGFYPGNDKINNRQSVDYGFPLDSFNITKNNQSKIDAFLNDLNSRFSLIMVSELFDESLILMRRLLNWSIKDILHIDKKVFKASSDTKPWIKQRNYTESVKQMFSKWATIDIHLYKYFLRVLKDKIKAQPRDFQDEVNTFKGLKSVVSEVCTNLTNNTDTDTPLNQTFAENVISKNQTTINKTKDYADSTRYFPATDTTEAFTLTYDDCKLMQLQTPEFTRLVKSYQYDKLFKLGLVRRPKTAVRFV